MHRGHDCRTAGRDRDPWHATAILLVWDHGRTPGCAHSKIAAPRGPWKQPGGVYVLDTDTTHYPTRRYQGVFMALYCDGHVAALKQTELLDSMFTWSGE